jgi:hypothetical protein
MNIQNPQTTNSGAIRIYVQDGETLGQTQSRIQREYRGRAVCLMPNPLFGRHRAAPTMAIAA